MSSWRTILALPIASLPAAALACKGGEGAIQMTEAYANISIGLILLAFGTTILLMKRAGEQLLLAPLVLGLLVPAHPRWFLMNDGDCGTMLLLMTSGVNLLAILLTVQHIVAVRKIMRGR